MVKHRAIGGTDKALVGVGAIQPAPFAAPGARFHESQLWQQRSGRFFQPGIKAGLQPRRPRRAQTFQERRFLPFAAENSTQESSPA